MARRIQAQILLISLAAAWVLALWYHERYIPYTTAAKCEWAAPDNTRSGENVTKIMLVADPQLIDNHTYPGRPAIFMAISKLFVDRYLRRNYHALVDVLQPDCVIFLGDYLDNGRSASDVYFYGQLARFKSIFFRKDYPVGEKMFLQVPGNHDLGWANGVKLASRQRFVQEFGPTNKVITIDGVDFVMVDAPSLGAVDLPAISDEALSFVDSLAGEYLRPRVMLSHIPLYRDTNIHQCGPLREGGPFRLLAGYQYQTVLDNLVSRHILDSVKPQIVFSGDDHDYCDITHSEGGPREVTVKSISMAMGINRPAVQLLAYRGHDAGHSSTILEAVTRPCYCTIPYSDICAYSVLAAATVTAILMTTARGLFGIGRYRSRRLC